MSDSVVRRRLVVSGRVQGVFFRDSLREVADRAGVAGWARNEPDGTVAVVLEGPTSAVQRVVEYCRKGPRQAHVEGVEVVDEEPERLIGFEIC
jgi:acylphosphatase